ncbi:MAG: OmpA family protein [Ignavibacteriaceae bacterium]
MTGKKNILANYSSKQNLLFNTIKIRKNQLFNIMKNFLIFKIILIAVLFNFTMFAQAYKTNWSLEFGGTYPRFVGITNPSNSSTTGYGAFVSLKRNFSEHSGLRFSINYNHLESNYNFNHNLEVEKLSLFAGNFDYLFYFAPCEPVSPYAIFGLGGMVFTPSNSPDKSYNKTMTAYQMNLGLGVEWKVGDDWNIITELSHHTASTNDLDGRDDLTNKGLFGSTADSYMKFDLGLVYYFSKGEPSKLCDLYSGLRVPEPKEIDYGMIEEMIKKYTPKEKKEVIVGQPTAPKKEHWVLVGVNFDVNSTKLRKDSYPILFYSFQVLQNNPEMNVEIEGYTDNIGAESYNLKLSEKRAKVVKDYLVSKGIAAGRLSVKGFGEKDPVADNNTAEGRAINRRIEFKIIK